MVTWGASRGLGLLTAMLALSQATDAAILPRQSNPALRPWVTVSPEGPTRTITPTINDGKTTSAFPGNTALPTADPKGAGSFLLCNPAAGSNGLAQPFCAPAADSELEGGRTYFVTWDASLFPSPNTVVQVQGDYGVSKFMQPGHGFTSQSIPASQGYFAWSVAGYDMPAGELLDVQLFLAVPATNGSITSRDKGPKVRVVNRPPKAADGGRRGVNVFGIVLPIVFGVLALGSIGWFVWWYGRRKGMFRKGGQGYGVGKSRGQRTDGLRLADGTFTSANRGGVEMMPPPRPPPPANGTGNAFREELNRQARNERAQSMM
ncbi:hypothetical protein CPLU01_14790 [Colletotrichum plurivorum]|uniref:Uncharacterized protein n=1 Tax=Colletotrichum plurivorum TaxID=2175906 RepID=A0A8H6JHZ9_9PEZI|nr:hypothetical protein CPLU01_14790 [Colletotrichum plurivorum]